MLVQHFGRAGQDYNLNAIAFLITEKAYFSVKWLDKWKNELKFLPSTPKKHHASPTCDSPSKQFELGNVFSLHTMNHQDPAFREASASCMLQPRLLNKSQDPNKGKSDSSNQDMDLDVDTEGANNINHAYHADNPQNPEAASVIQSRKQSKKSSKHATITVTDNEIEPAMEDFIYAEYLPEGHPHQGCRQKGLDHEDLNDRVGKYNEVPTFYVRQDYPHVFYRARHGLL